MGEEPYATATDLRPNAAPFRQAVMNFMDIQVERHLEEDEVRMINFIIKSRAQRYVADAKEDWIFPERYVSKSDWSEFGDGYLLMPEPRLISGGAVQIIMGYENGKTASFDEYGRPPTDPQYNTTDRVDGWASLHRFQGEFARRYGPRRRAQVWEPPGRLGTEEDGT